MTATQQMNLPKTMLEILERSRKEVPPSFISEYLEGFVRSVTNADLYWIATSYDNAGGVLREKHPLYKELRDLSDAVYWLGDFIGGIEGGYKTGRLPSFSKDKQSRSSDWFVKAFPELSKSVSSLLETGSQVESIQEEIKKRIQTLCTFKSNNAARNR